MSRRFFPLSEPKEGSRFANLSERLNAPLPGEPMYAEMSANEYPGAGSRSSRPAASPQTAKGPAKTKPAAPVAQPKVTPPTPAEAAQIAASAAKARHKAVMASSAVQGREKQAGELLLASCKSDAKFATADAIIAQLAKLPFDNQLAAVDKHLRSKAAQRVWNKAYGIAEPKAENAAKPKSAAAKVWEKAYGIAEPEPAKKETSAASVWDRANAKIERARA